MVRGVDRAVGFYRQVLGAELLMSLADKQGQVVHAEMDLGGSRLMLADEVQRYGTQNPESLGGSPCPLHVYVDDADATVSAAVDAGARLLIPVAEKHACIGVHEYLAAWDTGRSQPPDRHGHPPRPRRPCPSRVGVRRLCTAFLQANMRDRPKPVNSLSRT